MKLVQISEADLAREDELRQLSFQQIRDRYFAFEREFSNWLNTRDDMSSALGVATVTRPGQDAFHAEVSEEFVARVTPFLDRATRKPESIRTDLEDLHEKIVDGRPELVRLRDAYGEACARETARLAKPLIPEHREAVARLAEAIELMSSAVLAERSVRQRLGTTAPFPRSVDLPDMSSCFNDLILADPASTASAWARVARELKLL
jgi:hypothetical protein